MTTYHVFGDTGGHYQQLKAGLEAIGMNPKNHKLPKDVIVIHTGDLIHKGPSSPAVLILVDKVMEANPGQWVQILGNHEFQYIDGAPFFWGNVIPADSQRILASWLGKKLLKVAYAVEGPVMFHELTKSARPYPIPGKGALFTHAGVTKEFWDVILKNETDVMKIADDINNLPIKVVTKPGAMLHGAKNTPWTPVGPVWALSTGEVWESWKDEESMPFIQVHGHTTAYNFVGNRWWPTEKGFRDASKVNPDRNTVTTQVSDSIQIAIDPGYNTSAQPGPQPALKMTTES